MYALSMLYLCSILIAFQRIYGSTGLSRVNFIQHSASSQSGETLSVTIASRFRHHPCFSKNLQAADCPQSFGTPLVPLRLPPDPLE
jgi:hypothetical protein